MRQHDWERSFIASRRARAAAAFGWGAHDCVRVVVEFIERATGREFNALPDYSTLGQAAARVNEVDGGLEELVARGCARLKFLEVEVYKAQRGDVVWLPARGPAGGPWQGAPGVVDLDGHHAVTVAGRGLIRVPRAGWARAWRVG